MTDTDGFSKLTAPQLGEIHQAIKEQQLTVLKGLRDRPEAAAALPNCPACGVSPTEITQSHKAVPEVDLVFMDCGHRFRADEEAVLTAFRGPLRNG